MDLPNVVNAVELTPKRTIKTAKSIVRLPHWVNLFSGWDMARVAACSANGLSNSAKGDPRRDD